MTRLLLPGTVYMGRQDEEGYVDLLGKENAVGRHAGQRVFRSRFLPFVYERLWRPLVARFFFFGWGLKAADERRIVLDLMELSPSDQVIDIGCGPGNYSRYLARIARDGLVVGMDASEAMVAAASKRGGDENLAYLRADACGLPFGDGEFDAICCVGVLHMIDRPMAALAEMVRVLAPGGRLVVAASWSKRASARVRSGVTIFGRDEVTAELSRLGCAEVNRRVMRKAQFVSCRKPSEVSHGH